MDPIMDTNNKVCRACLGCCPQEYYNLNHGTPSYLLKLQECIPFLDFKIIVDPIICITCAAMLDRAYKLLIVIRNVESRLVQYMQDSSCIGACYIMARKPDDGILEHLKYHTVVDDAYNFRMVVAMAPKSDPDVPEADEGAGVDIPPVLTRIKVEVLDAGYDDDEQIMPDIHEMTPLLPEATSSVQFEPIPLDAIRSTVISLPLQPQPPGLPVSPSPTVNISSPLPRSSLTPLIYRIPNTRSSIKVVHNYNNSVGESGQSKGLVQCPVCLLMFRSLASHMKVHKSVPKLNMIMRPLVSLKQGILSRCVQCGLDYFLSKDHKCPFSCYVRLERVKALDVMARTWKRLQYCQHRAAIKQRALNSMHTESRASDFDSGNSSTMSALSIYDGDGETSSVADLDEIYRCVTCQLRFDNNVQLMRHLSLNHDEPSCCAAEECALNVDNVYDEHSYAWIKSIQCWNCSDSFCKREDWLTHDFTHHKTMFLICYICFRSYRHSHIISHFTNTHSLSMDEDNFFQMLHRQDNNAATGEIVQLLPTKPGSVIDETYSRMARFVMFECRLVHCPLCQRPCGHSSLLMRHLMLNRCTKSKCLLCKKDLDSCLHLLDHLMTLAHRRVVINMLDKFSYEKYMCPVCESIFSVETAFIQHSCFDHNNPFIVYKRKMGLWECSECRIMSPLGIAAKQQHTQSAQHLMHRLDRLLNSNGVEHHLQCHLCSQHDFKSKPALIVHLQLIHVVAQSVLCPLCHYMALNPDNFTRHLENVHPDFLANNDADLTTTTTTISSVTVINCPDEFTCLLCRRKHWTLNSFWKTCGKGHTGRNFSWRTLLDYLTMVADDNCLHIDGEWYNCECGRLVKNGSYLYKHYHTSRALFDGCTYWACCDVCGALITPRNNLVLHVEREHSRQKESSAPLLEITHEETANNDEAEPIVDSNAVSQSPELLLGKRTRRKTRLFMELEENGGLLASLKGDVNKSSKRTRRYSVHEEKLKEEQRAINLSELEQINHPSMQPVVVLERLPTTVDIQSSTDDVNTSHEHMIEAIERAAICADSVHSDDNDDDDDDDDDGRSSRSSEWLHLNQDEFIDSEEEICKNSELSAPSIEPKREQLNVNDLKTHDDKYEQKIEDNILEWLQFNDDEYIFNKDEVGNILTPISKESKIELPLPLTEPKDDESDHKNEQNLLQFDEIQSISEETDVELPLAVKDERKIKEKKYRNEYGIADYEKEMNSTRRSFRIAARSTNKENTFKISSVDLTNDADEEDNVVVLQSAWKVIYKCGDCGLVVPSSEELRAHSCSTNTNTVDMDEKLVNNRTEQVQEHNSLQPSQRDDVIDLVQEDESSRPTIDEQLSVCTHCDIKLVNCDTMTRHVDSCDSAARNRQLNRLLFEWSQSKSRRLPHWTSIQSDDKSDEAAGDSTIDYNIFRCLDCSLLLPGFFVAKTHFMCLHGDAAGAVYTCQMCDALAVSKQLMLRHKAWHREGAFKCIACPLVFNTAVDYRVHYGEHKLASCSRCQQVFLHLADLRAHLRTPHSAPKRKNNRTNNQRRGRKRKKIN